MSEHEAYLLLSDNTAEGVHASATPDYSIRRRSSLGDSFGLPGE